MIIVTIVCRRHASNVPWIFLTTEQQKKKTPENQKKKKETNKQKQSYNTWPSVVISMEYNFLHLHECIFLAARRQTKEWNVWRNTIPNITPRFIMTLYEHVHVNLKNFIKCMKTVMKFTLVFFFIYKTYKTDCNLERMRYLTFVIIEP